MSNIVIIGAGEIGRALGTAFDQAGHTVSYWDKNPEALNRLGKEQGELPEIMSGAHFVFFCVPSWAMREALFFVSSYFSPEHIVISLAKGLEDETAKTIDEVMADILKPKQPRAFLGGPMLAGEIIAGRYGWGLVGSSDEKVAQAIIELFNGSMVLGETSTDAHGVVVAGILKNIYAIAMGLADGLGWGHNAQAALVMRSLEEMRRLGRHFNLRVETLLWGAGLGDFLATGYSPESLNRSAGQELARRGQTSIKCEGLTSLLLLEKRIGADKISDLPILSTLLAIATGQVNPAEVFAENNLLFDL